MVFGFTPKNLNRYHYFDNANIVRCFVDGNSQITVQIGVNRNWWLLDFPNEISTLYFSAVFRCISISAVNFLYYHSVSFTFVVATINRYSCTLLVVNYLLRASNTENRPCSLASWIMASTIFGIQSQSFDYFLVLDFEATCERNARIKPQVNPEIF